MNKYTMFCGLLMLISPLINAKVTIYGVTIPGLHQADGNGAYDQIITPSLVQSGLGSLLIVPPARAEAEFAKCSNCCLSPANKNPEFYQFGDDVMVTKAMDEAKVFIFTSKGSSVISNLEGLKDKIVGARIGMPYGKSFENSGVNPKLVTDIKTNIKKLDTGRIDAFVAYTPDAYSVFEELGIPAYPHDKEHPIAVHPDAMVCRGVSAEFIKTFNDALP